MARKGTIIMPFLVAGIFRMLMLYQATILCLISFENE